MPEKQHTLRVLREQKGMKPAALAEQTGLSGSMIRGIEEDGYKIHLDSAIKVASFLGVDISEIFQKSEILPDSTESSCITNSCVEHREAEHKPQMTRSASGSYDGRDGDHDSLPYPPKPKRDEVFCNFCNMRNDRYHLTTFSRCNNCGAVLII